MNEITQIRKLSLWIFLVPLIAINLCLIISQNSGFLDNTIYPTVTVTNLSTTANVADNSCPDEFSILYLTFIK